MPIRDTAPGFARTMLACALAAVALVACGDDEQSAEGTADAGRPATETVAQPPPETAPDGGEAAGDGATADGRRTGGEVVIETDTQPEACPDVVITPDSGNGLFDVEAEGITCEDASAALGAWGRSGYPGEGPPGFACAPAPEAGDEPARLRCEQGASGGVVEFETGN